MYGSTSSGSWISAVFDEIALEGLNGTTLPWLWSLLATRLQCGSALPEKLQEQVWILLLRSIDKITFYELPQERPLMPPYHRHNDLDTVVGLPIVPKTCPNLCLPYGPVHDGRIMGNCADYEIRKPIDIRELQEMTALDATKRWNQLLVVVASQDQRIMALKPPNVLPLNEITVQQYIFWECIGQSRHNGETTAGPWSLTNYLKDASYIFYTKNKFLKQQLVVGQPYIERHNDRTICSMLLMLPRFFRVYKSHQQRAIENLYIEIKLRPDKQMLTTEIAVFLKDLTTAQLKKLLVTHNFRRLFETIQANQMSVSNRTGKEQTKIRKVAVLRLRNPDVKFEELSQVESNDVKEDKASTEFLNRRHAYLDMPIEYECLRAIMRFGSRGVSVLEMAHYVALTWQTARNCIKYLMREHLIKGYTENVGKTRILRYVAGIQAAAALNLKQQQLEMAVQQLQCQEELNMPLNVDIVLNELPEITVNLRRMVFSLKTPSGEKKESSRQFRRKTLIVRQIDKRCIMHSVDIINAITQAERNIGFQETICRKSLFRLLQKMSQAGIVNVYELTLQYQKRIRLYRLVTHPKIDMQHEQLQREILRFKSNFHLTTEERMSRPSQQPTEKERKELLARKMQCLEREHQGASKPSAPKLLLARTLHEFLFYLLIEQHCDQKPLIMSPKLLHNWQRTDPSLKTREFLHEWSSKESHILPYTQEISWRTFIPPLPHYEDKSVGWLHFMDAVKRMPLSLIMRIFRIDRDIVDQLRPHLQHPVRQHYLLQQLELKNIIPRLRLQQLYVATLRLLNNMGLVQVTERQLGRDSLQRWVYLNRRTCLLDTTTSSGHNYNRISPERTYEELKFEFNSREQVSEYWAKLQHVCIFTKLGFLKHRERRIGSKKELRRAALTFVRTIDFNEALELDDGTVPGDRQGAAGISSELFAHQFRHWSWVKRTTIAAVKHSNSSSSGQATAGLPVRKRLSLMRLKPVPKIPHRKKRGTSSMEDGRKRKSGPRDEIDRDALCNMRTLRVTWTTAEDRLLKMGRAVYLLIDAPLPTLALYNVGTICRDVIRQYIGICNKTSQACVRRLQFLIRMKRDLPDVPNWIYMMQTNQQFNTVYNERFLVKLKREYPSRTELNEAILVHFVLILSKLHHMVNNTDAMPSKFLLPDTLDDYQRQFRECMPLNADVDQVLYANPNTETELQVTVALGVLHSILCCAKDKTLFNLQAFEIYKHFSEDVLNSAFNKARTDSLLVAVKRRNIQAVSRQISGPAHLLSSKYKYRLFCLKLGHTLYESFYTFEKTFNEQTETVKLTSPNFSQLVFISERLANNRLHLTLQLPVNILTVDTSSISRQTGSSTDRILDHYSSIFDNAPQTEYAKRLESECTGRHEARVRFHPANLTYRLSCNAYNQLSKLPMRAMHFYCALDSLGQSINISNTRVELGECPFGCIMRSGNYMNAVERIVNKHGVIFKQLFAEPLQQAQLQLHLGSSTACSTTVIVSTDNLMTLSQQLESYWRQQQQMLECKDLGKPLAESTLHKLTDWQSLCNGLLDIEAGKQDTERVQDYEPALNKEERARAQDVFVVHLPTICLEETTQKHMQKNQANTYKALLDKVAKFTYWRYTENSFETLLPKLKYKNYDANAIQHMEDLLRYIEERPLGVVSTELRRIFPFKKFLLEALHELEGHDLVKRVGVASQIYVHKTYMRNWVVHTFHIKRLERERVQTLVADFPATPHAVVGQKRKLMEEQQDQSSTSKKSKVPMTKHSSEDTESDEALPKRSQRVKLNEINKEYIVKSSNYAGVSRDVIVMRPQPWIRVNASLNRRVLDRWMSAILSECVTRTGCTVHSLFLRFPHLMPADTMLLLELLIDLDCIHLMELEPPKVHVENTYDEEFKEQKVTELYDPSFTYVKTHSDAIGRLTNFIGLKKYNTEFI